MEGFRPGETQSPEPRWPVSRTTHLALAALMAMTPLNKTEATQNPSSSHQIEAKGNKVEVFKNITILPIGPSYIDWQKRYQEVSIVDGGDPKKHGDTILVRVLNEMSTSNEYIGQLTKGADGEYWFTSQKIGKTVYPDVPSDGNGEQ